MRAEEGSRLERLFRHAYELAVLAAFLTLAFAPFHARATRLLSVRQTLPDGRVLLKTSEAGSLGLREGESLPVYRFGRHWESEIGRVRVVSVSGERILCRHGPADFRWPIGRQGSVMAQPRPGLVEVSLGRDCGLRPGDRLVLFRERERVGRVRLAQVGEKSSSAEVLAAPAGTSLEGLTVSEFAVPTTVAVLPSRALRRVEIALIVLLVAGWAAAAACRRSVFELARWALKRLLPAGPGPAAGWAFHFALGLPASWLLGRTLVFLPLYLLGQLGLLPPGLRAGPEALRAAVLLCAAGYYAFFVATGRSPCLALWEALSYRAPEGDWRGRRWLDWGLHLIIAYAFARTLHLFLAANLSEVGRVWSAGSLRAEDYFLVARYLLWSATIAGCLLGYAHTVVSILWKRSIRRLDFTVLGWATNAACYPLLGAVVVQVLPPFSGAGPVVAQGPWHWLMLAAELFLNLLYTLSIWNLGTMFGVMTDKGVRTTGFYSFVRHPNYTLEALMFLVMGLRGFATPANWASGVMLYAFLYWIRSEREDQFMSRSNPDYAAYRERVPWKYLPGLA